jgi:flagellar FliJ protein
MSQLRLLRSAHEFLERNERRQQQVLAECERQVKEADLKLTELERYRLVYLRDFDERAGVGMSAAHARTYQAFMVRMSQAVTEQQQLLARARVRQADELRKWRTAARRCAALQRILEQREVAARHLAEKAAQAQSDAHAQRVWTQKGARRGH